MSRLPYDIKRYGFFVIQVLQKVMAVWDHSDITVGKVKKEKGTTRQIIPYCICSSNQSGIWLLMIALSWSIAIFLSSGSSLM